MGGGEPPAGKVKLHQPLQCASLRLGSPGHITRVGHPRAAGGLRERLGGQVSKPPGPGVAWL